ncbi:MAG: hypothetical protein IJR49_04200, partial [Treponema sp.]|nr:hypothetical protein [Treponema sp.]
FLSLLIRFIIRKCNIEKNLGLILLAFLISFVILYQRLLFIFVPDIAVQLGLILYFPAISSYVTTFLLQENVTQENNSSKIIKQCIFFSLFSLAFFLFRDVAGFGTITLILHTGFFEKVLFDPNRISFLTFFASIPGAIVCVALLLPVYAKFLIGIEKKQISEEQNSKSEEVSNENV